MNRHRILLVLALCMLAVLAMRQSIAPASAHAPAHPGLQPGAWASGGGYELTWHVIAGEGATSSTGGTYSLTGTIGQADTGMMSGGGYSLSGGFWVDFLGNHLSLPLIEK